MVAHISPEEVEKIITDLRRALHALERARSNFDQLETIKGSEPRQQRKLKAAVYESIVDAEVALRDALGPVDEYV